MKSPDHRRIELLSNALREQQRDLATRSLRAFGRLYLPHHFTKPPSRMHEELYQMLDGLHQRPGARIAIAAPRGNAKSTLISLAYVLWSVVCGHHRFIVLISDTADKAAEFLEHIKHELVHNDRLVADYPEVCEPGRKMPRFPRWRNNEIVTNNGIKITALGYGQNIRGRRHVENRPDLIILDDVETRENTLTPEARHKVDDWFNKSILKAGTKATQVLVVGTIQHYDALLARLTNGMRSPFWDGRVFRAVIRWPQRPELWQTWAGILHGRGEHEGPSGLEAAAAFFSLHREAMLAGAEVLWPERENYYTLMLMRESDGPASFDSEMQNEPVNPQDCCFLEEEFVYWDDRFGSAQELISSIQSPQFVGACDPSLGRLGKHADDSAIITLVRDPKAGTLHVLDADIRRLKPDQIIDAVIEYARLRSYCRFGFETNQFQAFLAEELKRRSNLAHIQLPVEDIRHTSDKAGRIQSLQPLIRSGTLQFSRRQTILLDQLKHFPKATHDDGPDALEMAVATSRKVNTWSLANAIVAAPRGVFTADLLREQREHPGSRAF